MPGDEDIPCPVCGFLRLEGAYGSYVICPVCEWEDDQVQLANPVCTGGANSESLIDAQAARSRQVSFGRGSREGRPSRPAMATAERTVRSVSQRGSEQEYWKNKGIVDISECYWIKNPTKWSAG